MPAAISAPLIPTRGTSTSIDNGASALPSMPAKVCTEKARPIRAEATRADRIA